ncbi:hypothetical protein [Actinophytocola sp. NPDC049390]|uniref:hypothetical protein n=1 Tax=Actinophytocola sp. NPDC049390 TaxID=3363894 RepID=UPI00379DD8A6
MAHDLAMSTWMDLSGGTPLSYSVSGSDVAHVMIGSGNTICELVFDSLAMRAMAELSIAVVTEMDARYQQETAAGHVAPGRHHLNAS